MHNGILRSILGQQVGTAVIFATGLFIVSREAKARPAATEPRK